ncbi:hypothetical protein POTOM_020436 [Populus tomentosa]|uniref:AAA+ ATPase domain-containing protein n=1 Tax=Populus tomentosa TaxID=118781 RepID=A0A8X7ZS96_POPTO|nr:hypothetical protein POTOM_020436 [Populus tomentosa]
MATPMAEDSSFEDDQLASMTTEDIIRGSRLVDNEIRILKEEVQRTNLELDSYKEKIKENQEKIKLNKQLPYLVGNIVEILEMNPEDEAEEDGANIDLDSQRKGKCVVLKTSTRQTIFLPVVGLVDPDKLKPGDLVGVNKDSYLILDTLPSEYDSRVKAMEVDEKPTEDYNDIGGLEKQIQELVEAIVLPMTHKERFQKLGIRPPKGILLYGPPGTGKTLMARACAAQTNATFLKLAGPQLVQMFIGDGAKLVRDAFQLAKEKSPCIIFIDEIDAIGTKRFDSEVSGDREVQRTMLELLNQLDGFSSDDSIKVIAATNRADILDPALMRSGRLDRKIEFPHPTEEARARILQIHSRKMNVHPDVNFEELARSTDDFNGAQLKAVCVEAGMLALRRDATEDATTLEKEIAGQVKADGIFDVVVLAVVSQTPNSRKIPGEIADGTVCCCRSSQKMCAGSPILLGTIARALKDGDSSEWKDALEKLKRFDKDEMDGHVYSALDIAILDVLKHTVGLGLLKRTSTLEEAGNRLHKLVNDLRASCLLLEGDADGRVTFATSVASRDHHVFTAAFGTVLKNDRQRHA